MLDEDGNVQATASWEYIPKYAVKAVSELKELIQSSGNANAARYIHIEHLQVIVSNIEAGGVQNIVAGDNIDNSTSNSINITRENQSLEEHLEELAAQGDGAAAAQLQRILKSKKKTTG
ncbi:hypothetical protein ABTD98_13830 [Acinetobacter baumannii]|uniref:hypothetical protein n=1 Tax=Acinetobacter baumannii TaxID=470 RepID=UPI001FF550F1|nr:hypothetical protein [Acinetobacter baumannii]MDO5926356.1 hypothetical protein [Acinetobacter baumannii]